MAKIRNDWEIEQFRSLAMTGKDDVLGRIKYEQESCRKAAEDGTSKKAYFEALNRIYGKLYKKVESSSLFEAPEGLWEYVIETNVYGIKVKLALVDGVTFDNVDYYGEVQVDIYDEIVPATSFESDGTIDEYTMFEVPCNMLTVDEYASLYNVTVTTVRQWIRRGKIRSAIKAGSEWRIPELAPVPKETRGYKSAFYKIKDAVHDIPAGYEFMTDFEEIHIVRDEKDKNLFTITFFKVKDNGDFDHETKKVIQCDLVERERFELFLISSADVIFDDDFDEFIEGIVDSQ